MLMAPSNHGEVKKVAQAAFFGRLTGNPCFSRNNKACSTRTVAKTVKSPND